VNSMVYHVIDVRSVIQSLKPSQWHTALTDALQHCTSNWVLFSSPSMMWTSPNRDALHRRLQGIRQDAVCVVLSPKRDVDGHVGHGGFQMESSLWPTLWRVNVLKRLLMSMKRVAIPSWRYLIPDILLSLPAGVIEKWYWSDWGIDYVGRSSPLLLDGDSHIFPVLKQQNESTTVTAVSPMVSVLMSVYNDERYIAWAIRSVLAQARCDWELLIGDDGSSDLSADTAARVEDNRIQVKRFRQNRGKAHVLNDLMQHVQGKYVIELDADDWLSPDALQTLVSSMEEADENTGLLTGPHYLWSKVAQGDVMYKGIVLESCSIHGVNPVPPVPRFFRTSAIHKVGGWPTSDVSSGRLFEDIAICSMLLQTHIVKRMNQPVYHRLLRHDSISNRFRHAYPSWSHSWFTR
jgi:hypothetical protein